MTGSHSRLVAVQTVVVGVLLVLVFITLLAPESDSPLSGIEGPGGPIGLTDPGPDIYTGPDRPGGGGGEGPGGGPGGDGPGGGPGGGVGGQGGVPGEAGVPPIGLTDPAAGGGGTAGGEDGGGGGNPTDDQYRDSLSRLVARLN